MVLQGASLLLQVPHLFALMTCFSHWNPPEFLGKGSLSPAPLRELRCSPRLYLCSTHQTEAVCRTALVCKQLYTLQRREFPFVWELENDSMPQPPGYRESFCPKLSLQNLRRAELALSFRKIYFPG